MRWRQSDLTRRGLTTRVDRRKNDLTTEVVVKKFNNVPSAGYASKRESRRASELRQKFLAGHIQDLREQVVFELLPKQVDELTGRCLERACKYVADFVYVQDGRRVVEDSKGFRTEVYRIKKKLMLYIHGIKIFET